MKKKILDYLHLYLSCDCQRMGEIDENDKPKVSKLTGISYDDTQREWWAYFENEESGASIVLDVFPILRHLSDMTEEEMKEIVLLNYNVAATIKEVWIGQSDIVGFSTSGLTGGGRIDLLASSPETFRYLLSKHFDLFNLISDGLAIDKTKQQSLKQ